MEHSAGIKSARRCCPLIVLWPEEEEMEEKGGGRGGEEEEEEEEEVEEKEKEKEKEKAILTMGIATWDQFHILNISKLCP